MGPKPCGEDFIVKMHDRVETCTRSAYYKCGPGVSLYYKTGEWGGQAHETERSQFLAKWAWALMGKDVIAPPPHNEILLYVEPMRLRVLKCNELARMFTFNLMQPTSTNIARNYPL